MRNQDSTLDGLFDVMREETALSERALEAMLEAPGASKDGVRSWWIVAAAVIIAAASLVILDGQHNDGPRDADGGATRPSTAARGEGAGPQQVENPEQARRAESIETPARDTHADDAGAGPGTAGRKPAAAQSSDDAPAQTKSGSTVDESARLGTAVPVDASTPPLAPAPVGASTRLVVPVTVDPTRLIELSSAELTAIGLWISEDSTIEAHSQGYSISRSGSAPPKVERSISRWRFSGDEGTAAFIPESSLPSGVLPAAGPNIVTDLQGNRRFFTLQPTWAPEKRSDFIQRKTDSIDRARLFTPMNVDGLIPIRVGAIDGRVAREELILWYSPTAGLIDALPPCLREQLIGELDPAARAELEGSRERIRRSGQALAPELKRVHDSIMTRHARIIEPCDRPLPGGRLLDLWRARDGAIHTSSLTPSNFHERTALRLDMDDPREINVSLHDMRGRLIRPNVASATVAEGSSTVQLPFDGIAAGIYLVVVQTDRGERAVLRAVVE